MDMLAHIRAIRNANQSFVGKPDWKKSNILHGAESFLRH